MEKNGKICLALILIFYIYSVTVYQGMVDDGELQDPIEKYRKRKHHERNEKESDSEEDKVYVEYEVSVA